MIESRRGAGWHQFGGLSAPVAQWFAAYYVPGTLTTGFDVFVQCARWLPGNAGLEAELYCTRPGRTAVLAALAPGKMRISCRLGVAAEQRHAGLWEITLDVDVYKRQGVQRTGKPSGLKRVPYTVFSLHMEESNMKKMKRIISAALTLALAAGMLAGCAGSSSGTPAASSAGGASAGSSSAERERITVRVFRSKASHCLLYTSICQPQKVARRTR